MEVPNTKSPHLLTFQVGARTFRLAMFFPDQLAGAGHGFTHHLRPRLIRLDFGLTHSATRFGLGIQPALFLGGHRLPAWSPAAIAGQLDHRAHARARLAERTPHRLGVRRAVTVRLGTPRIPGVETV